MALLTCALLAILHTWPLALAPHRLSRHDNGDVMLNEWILAWVQHQLPRDPMHLFEANIFYPAHDVLAFSEPLIVPALMGAPLRWLGGSPVLVHNVLVIVGFVLSALAAYALVHAWTDDPLAALVAASAFAFNTQILLRTTHLQAVHAYGLPLALLAADRLLVEHRIRRALSLAAWLMTLAYTSGYLMVFGTVVVALAVLTRPGDWIRVPLLMSRRFLLAAALSAVTIAPLYMAYHRAAADQGLVRSLENVAEYSATWRGYLVTAGRLHSSMWSSAFFRDDVDAFFPGVLVLLLSIVGVVLVWRSDVAGSIMKRRVVMLVAMAVVGVVLSLGTNTPLYEGLYAMVAPLRSIRVAARFGNLFLLAVALLAGIGAARLRVSRIFGRASAAVLIAFVAVVNLEALRAPFEYRPFDGIPNLYTILAREPGPVVLVEQPFYPPEGIFQNAEYVLNSTAHWRPLMNGYSGFIPRSYREFVKTFWFFPREHAIAAMRRAGVTHVIVHPERFGNEAAEVKRVLESNPDFERVAVGRQEITLYRLH